LIRKTSSTAESLERCSELFGIAYIFARSWWTNDYSDATALNLIGAALVGAVAGIAAFAVHWSTGADGK